MGWKQIDQDRMCGSDYKKSQAVKDQRKKGKGKR